MTRERLIILMGSKSDLSFASQIGAFLAEEGFRIQCEYGVASAHRTPEMLLEKMRKNEMSGDNLVYVTVAGLSDALSGVVAGFTKYPVLACPPDIDKSGWTKAFSSFMTPKGVPVLLVSSPENAALAAARILALANPSLGAEIEGYVKKKKEEVVQADREVAGGKV